MSKTLTKSIAVTDLAEMHEITITKWQIISEYYRIVAKSEGKSNNDAKIHGMVMAICGWKSRNGSKGGSGMKKVGEKVCVTDKKAKEHWITPDMFDKDVTNKLGRFYPFFSSAIENMINKGYSYEEVKDAVEMPRTIGARVPLDNFKTFF